jgi:hypothetical protein
MEILIMLEIEFAIFFYNAPSFLGASVPRIQNIKNKFSQGCLFKGTFIIFTISFLRHAVLGKQWDRQRDGSLAIVYG